MNILWTYINQKNWTAITKYKAVSLILGALYSLVGLILWLVVRMWILSTLDWMICFMGYGMVIGWLSVFFYSLRHDFHDGKPEPDSRHSEFKEKLLSF